MLEKFFKAKFYVHFTVWFVLITFIFGTLVFLASSDIQEFSKFNTLLLVISVVLSLGATGMMWLGNQANKYYDALDLIKAEARNSLTGTDRSPNETVGPLEKELLPPEHRCGSKGSVSNDRHQTHLRIQERDAYQP